MATKHVFIASSSEAMVLAEAFAERLKQLINGIKIYSWYAEAPKYLGKPTLAMLKDHCNKVDFCVVFLTADDVSVIRKQELLTPRDNTIFELGLFMGVLDRDETRCFIVCGAEQKALPNDLAGITYQRITEPHDKRNIHECQDAVSGPALHIAGVIQQADPFDRHGHLDLITSQELRLRESSAGVSPRHAYYVEDVLVSAAQPYESRDAIFAESVMHAIKLRGAKYDYFWGEFDENMENAAEFIKRMVLASLPEGVQKAGAPVLSPEQKAVARGNLEAMRAGLRIHFLKQNRAGDFCIHNPKSEFHAVTYKRHPLGFVRWEQGRESFDQARELFKKCAVSSARSREWIFHCTADFSFDPICAKGSEGWKREQAKARLKRALPFLTANEKLWNTFFERSGDCLLQITGQSGITQ